MGQKVSPVGFRIGVIRDWESRWYSEKEYGDLLLEDVAIRELVLKECKDCKVSRVEIERSKNHVTVFIRTAAPGMILGASRSEDGNADNKETKLKDLNKKIGKLIGDKTLKINVIEVGNPDLDARLVALKIVKMLEERQSFRTAQKKAIQQTMRAGAKGIKTAVSGRLGGADIARSEGYSEGVVPLHTLRSDIDYDWEEAMTTYGKLGVKVWICRGEVFPGEMVVEPEKPKTPSNQGKKRQFNRRPRQEAKVEETAPAVEAAKQEEVKEDEE